MKDRPLKKLLKGGDVVLSYYEAGLTRPGGPLWNDAEQFLQRLQLASEDHVSLANQIKGLLLRKDAPQIDLKDPYSVKVASDLKLLHCEAARSVAAACTGFLLAMERPSPRASDIWEPYMRWLVMMDPQDTVITFNYDRVVDFLNCEGKANVLVSPIADDFIEKRAEGRIPICHMHGNVSWRLASRGKGKGTKIVVDRRKAVAHLHPEQAVLGIPGDAKELLTTGLLKPVWELAEQSIKAASAVVFVGYRFPPSDSTSRKMILEALKEGSNARVHCVLGPSTLGSVSSADVARLRGMVEWAGRSFCIHDMYAEDFLAVFERNGLFEPRNQAKAS